MSELLWWGAGRGRETHILAFVRQQSDSKLLHTKTGYLFQLYSLNNKVSDFEFCRQQGIMQTEMKSSFFISSNWEKMDGKYKSEE